MIDLKLLYWLNFAKNSDFDLRYQIHLNKSLYHYHIYNSDIFIVLIQYVTV